MRHIEGSVAVEPFADGGARVRIQSVTGEEFYLELLSGPAAALAADLKAAMDYVAPVKPPSPETPEEFASLPAVIEPQPEADAGSPG